MAPVLRVTGSGFDGTCRVGDPRSRAQGVRLCHGASKTWRIAGRATPTGTGTALVKPAGLGVGLRVHA